MIGPEDRLRLPARLAAVRRTGLLDTGAEEPFDRLTGLACELLGSPFGFVTIVDERRSFWKSCVGVTSNEIADRQNPVGESFCQYVIATDAPVVIGDARLDPMTRDNPSIRSMGVIAWAGFPVRSPDGHVLGSFCVVDNTPREWTGQDLRTIEVLAQAAGGEVALRIRTDEAIREAAQARRVADDYQHLAHTFRDSLLPPELPEIDGLDLAAAYEMTRSDVVGDFYDAVATPTGWAVFLGDVAADGVHAARTAALARHTLRAAAMRATSPAIVLNDLDEALRGWQESTVAVGYVALRETGTGYAARICLAGRPVATIRRADGTQEPVASQSNPLDGRTKLALSILDAELRSGDCVILSTTAVPVPSDAAPDARRITESIMQSAPAGDLVVVTIRIP